MTEPAQEQLSQPAELRPQQDDQETPTYTHCIICHRGFKRPKKVPMGPVCAKKHAKREEYWNSLSAPNREAEA